MSEVNLAKRIYHELALSKEFSSLALDLRGGGTLTIGLEGVEYIPFSSRDREKRFQEFAQKVHKIGADVTKIKI